jgi:hypothetical protein
MSKKRTPADRQRNAVKKALEKAAMQLEAFQRSLTGTEAAAVVMAVLDAEMARKSERSPCGRNANALHSFLEV